MSRVPGLHSYLYEDCVCPVFRLTHLEAIYAFMHGLVLVSPQTIYLPCYVYKYVFLQLSHTLAWLVRADCEPTCIYPLHYSSVTAA